MFFKNDFKKHYLSSLRKKYRRKKEKKIKTKSETKKEKKERKIPLKKKKKDVLISDSTYTADTMHMLFEIMFFEPTSSLKYFKYPDNINQKK